MSAKRTADIECAIICHHGDYLEYNIQSVQTYSGRDLSIRHKGNVPPGIEDFDTLDW